MFINDVGETTWEEINEGIAGKNYGWPVTEGFSPDPRFESPVYTYGHNDGCAITGGVFYNPPKLRFPGEYVGTYFFADLCGGWIRNLNPRNRNVTEFASRISAPVDMLVSPEGSLYYLARGNGAVYRVDATTPPSAQGRFVPVTPCRLIDTRLADGPLAGPVLNGNDLRSFTIGDSPCGIPRNALAYSLNLTVVPQGPLGFLTVWPTGLVRPFVSTLNSDDGRIVADAAIVAAGASGAISFYVTNPTHLIVDINGYFVDPVAAPQSLAFYPVTLCRLVDTRLADGPFGGPIITGQQSRSFELPSGVCNVPPTAQSYSVNVTVVPTRPLGYLTLWPTGQTQPLVSTLNSPQGQVVANAALVPAGNNGAISIFVTDSTHVIVDVNGYFAAPGGGGLNFVPITPCRTVDTRNPPGIFGAPFLSAGSIRDFPVITSSCEIPSTVGAYSVNATVVPYEGLGYLTLWPTQQMQPVVSTLNSLLGKVVSNGAIVPAGLNGAISAFVSNRTELVLDINGYFAP